MATMPTLDNPLKAADLRELNTSIYLLMQLMEMIDKAEQAGRDVTAIRLRRDDLYNQAMAVKQTYFPGER